MLSASAWVRLTRVLLWGVAAGIRGPRLEHLHKLVIDLISTAPLFSDTTTSAQSKIVQAGLNVDCLKFGHPLSYYLARLTNDPEFVRHVQAFSMRVAAQAKQEIWDQMTFQILKFCKVQGVEIL